MQPRVDQADRQHDQHRVQREAEALVVHPVQQQPTGERAQKAYENHRGHEAQNDHHTDQRDKGRTQPDSLAIG